MFTIRIAAIFILSLLIFQSQPSRADDGPKKMPELSKEERTKRAEFMDKVADVHKKMAECLRSDKPMSECHDLMQTECPMAKADHCPFIDDKYGMKGMHRMHGRRKATKDGESATERK